MQLDCGLTWGLNFNEFVHGLFFSPDKFIPPEIIFLQIHGGLKVGGLANLG